MKLARIACAAAIAAVGAVATAGVAAAYHHSGYYSTGPYGTYYQPQYRPYYQPYYAPAPPPPRYYGHHGYPYGYNSYRPRPHGGVFIRTPGLRLGIGW